MCESSWRSRGSNSELGSPVAGRIPLQSRAIGLADPGGGASLRGAILTGNVLSFGRVLRAWSPVLAASGVLAARAQLFSGLLGTPDMDMWMYPFEFGTGGTRPFAPNFPSFDPRFDMRDAKFLVGWETPAALGVPTNLPPSRYLVRSVRVTMVNAVLPNLPPSTNDPTYDSTRTYLPDSDPGRPVKLFGAGFRGGFTALTYGEESPFGPLNPITWSNIFIGTRNAFAAQFDIHGVLIDIANNVGQTSVAWTNALSEVAPGRWAAL